VKRTHWEVNATPEEAFALVSDLTRSPEWATNPLTVESVSGGPIAVGSKYRSEARFMGKDVHAEQEITAYDPPTHFAFTNMEGRERYLHDFNLREENGKTVIERTITFLVPGARGIGIRLVVPFIGKKFDRESNQKLTEIFPGR